MVSVEQLCEAAELLQQRWEANDVPFCVIGGLALQKWGEPRFTADIDVTIFVGFGGEKEAVRHELEVLKPRIPDAARFALANRVLLVEDAKGNPVDISLGAMPYERECIERSSKEVLAEDCPPIRICSASDLIILKTFAGREQDWVDVSRILVRNFSLIDWGLVTTQLESLLALKEEPESLERLLQLKRNLST